MVLEVAALGGAFVVLRLFHVSRRMTALVLGSIAAALGLLSTVN